MDKELGPGQIIGQHYKLTQLLGSGGQSEVYRGRDLSGGPDVAVKVMKQQIASSPNARERMSREARALMSLAGTPAAIQLLGQYWTPDGRMVLVTELLEGESLQAHLDKQPNYRMDPSGLIELLPPVIETLASSHRQGVVHRDLKPANLYLVDRPPFVRLLDFGYAKFMRLRSFTEAGMVAGSPNYISPEAWSGRQDLDARADVYSLGALLFRCIAGRCPFESESLVDLLGKVTRSPRPRLTDYRPDLSPMLDAWTELALAADRDRRFQNVNALWVAFVTAAGRKAS